MGNFRNMKRLSLLTVSLGILSLSSNIYSQSQELIDAATKEGKVSIFGTLDAGTAKKIVDSFEKKYPGIEVSYWRGSGTAVLKKTMSEFRADKVTWNVQVHTPISW